MNRNTAIILSAALLAFWTPAARSAPKVFTDPRAAIQYAKENERLLIFLMMKRFDDRSEKAEAVVARTLEDREKEFVVVRCELASAAHRQIFSERFKQDPEKIPLAVVADATGKAIAAAAGLEPESYAEMIEASRIKAGVEKDPERIAAILEELGPEGEEYLVDGTFGVKKKDVMARRILLTEYRVWIFKNGATVRAALLEAKGATGIFVREEDRKEVELNFNDLSDGDKAFLTTVLSKPKEN